MENEKFVIIKEMSAGNETIGEMWQETKVFDGNATLSQVMKWAMCEGNEYSRKKIIITKPHN